LLSIILAWFFITLVPISAASLTVAAASDMAAAEHELTDSFHKVYPADSVRFAFAASGALAQQIANGAEYDVFLSADEGFIDQLAAGRKILPDTVHVYALGQLGILWRDGKTHNLNDLAADWVRLVAIANPRIAPYGLAARQALETEGLWDTVRPKIVFGENVRQALQMFDSGNADAVLTAYSLMTGRPAAAVVPEDWHKPIRQKAGVVAASSQPDAARKFLAFLRSPEGARILTRHGLKPVE
jgi:molybdate transport system substrate-binding protein